VGKRVSGYCSAVNSMSCGSLFMDDVLNLNNSMINNFIDEKRF